MKSTDLTGQKFNRLTVLRFSHKTKNNRYWVCLCDCGVEKLITGASLRAGTTKSCGCHRTKRMVEYNFKHGDIRTDLYTVWHGMNERCHNPLAKGFKAWGGRGITVCEEWRNDYLTFKDWALKAGYTKGLSLDRIDNNGNYEPSNCRWATAKTQANNRRSNIIVTYQGKEMTLGQAIIESGTLLTPDRVGQRFKVNGMSLEDSLMTPLGQGWSVK